MLHYPSAYVRQGVVIYIYIIYFHNWSSTNNRDNTKHILSFAQSMRCNSEYNSSFVYSLRCTKTRYMVSPNFEAFYSIRKWVQFCVRFQIFAPRSLQNLKYSQYSFTDDVKYFFNRIIRFHSKFLIRVYVNYYNLDTKWYA